MSNLMRTNEATPRWGLFGDEFDNLFEGFLRPLSRQGATSADGLVPAMDVTETESKYVIKADLPGIDKKDIHVSINDDVLTINAQSRTDTEDKDDSGRVIGRGASILRRP